MAGLLLNQQVHARLRGEVDNVVGYKDDITDTDVAKMPYLQAVLKETLRVHPCTWATPFKGPAVHVGRPTQQVWEEPSEFKPKRFVKSDGGVDVDVRGVDLRLAPFGAGRRDCPGKNPGLVTVGLWVAKLVRQLERVQDETNPVDLTEVLKLSCEMKNSLKAVAIPRVI